MSATTRQPQKKVKTSASKSRLQPKRTLAVAAQHHIEPGHSKLPGVFELFGRALTMLKRHWKLFLSIALVYGILNLLLVRGLAGGTNLSNIKSTLEQAIHGGAGKLSTGLTLFLYLLGNSGNSSSANAGVYQTLLIILISLALIWTLRQLYTGASVRMRDAFYKGIYPFIPFVLVLLVVGLELLPLLIGATIYSTVNANGIAIGAPEKILWLVLFVGLALASLYLLCSSVFALYVVTLPDMTPMKALRSARALVKHRRWLVLRKLLFLPLALLVLAAIILLPLILFVTPLAGWILFALSVVGLAVIHSYMYALYRELLV